MAITTVSSHVVSVNAIQGTLIADNAITAVHIATNAVSGTLIADNAITAVHVAQNSITVTQLADDCVESDKIADGVITTNHLNKAMISSQTEVTPVAGDFVLLGDTSDSNNLKKAPLTLLLNSNVDLSSKLNLSGGTLTGNLTLFSSAPVLAIKDGGTHGTNSTPYLEFRDSSSIQSTIGITNTAGDLSVWNSKNTNLRFATNNTEKIRITADGNLEFKAQTTNFVSPGFTWHTNNYLYLRGGSAGTIIADDSGINTVQIIDGSSGFINFETGDGTSRMRIKHDGKVGIGTITPGHGLDVQYTTSSGTSDAIANFGTSGSGNWANSGHQVIIGGPSVLTYTGLIIHSDSTSGNGQISFADGRGASDSWRGVVAYNHASDYLHFWSNANERMRIDSSGNVKIGNTSGNGILNVDNGATDGGYVHFANNVGSTTLTNDKGLAFGWNKSNGGGESIIIGNQGAGSTGGLVFATNTSGGSYAEKMRIHASGCVGVGSTADRSLGTNIGTLVVNGSAGGGLWLSPGDSSGMTSKIYAEANGSVGDLIINNGTGVGSGGIRFQTNSAQKMILDSAGRLLINKTSSSLTFGKLQVEAGGEASGHGGIVFFGDSDVSVGSGNVIQVLWFYGDNDATGGVFTRYRDGNSIMGQVTAANGTQVSYGVSSDERLKKNIVDASSQLNTIKNIKVREFDWKANGYHEVGMIAQELHTVVPNVVQEGGDDINEQPWGVDYSKLTPYLIKAVQELSAKNDALEARITTLEG